VQDHPLIIDSLTWSGYHSTNMLVLVFIKDLIITTFSQMASLLAGVFLFGLSIHFISLITFRSIERAFSSKGTYLVAWLGTPIHELGHAIFCVIFMHKIMEIKFFKPDPLTGTLGYVSHQWNRSNPWQVLGNLFIGIGPVIIGSAVLFAIFYFLIPDSSLTLAEIESKASEIDNSYVIGSYFEVIRASAFTIVKSIFTVSNLTSWRFWVFCYLSICIASNIRLSLSDIKGSLSGLGCLVLPFLLINLLGLVTGLGTEGLFPFSASSLGIVYGLLILALTMTVIGFLLTYFISATYVKIRHGYILNPF
jgi:hypothetical protein